MIHHLTLREQLTARQRDKVQKLEEEGWKLFWVKRTDGTALLHHPKTPGFLKRISTSGAG
jgi:hypothetical protein